MCPFPSCLSPLFQSESQWIAFHIRISFSKWFEPRGIGYLFGVIVQVKVVFRKTVVGDWRFDYLSDSHLQNHVKSRHQMMVFMSLVLVLRRHPSYLSSRSPRSVHDHRREKERSLMKGFPLGLVSGYERLFGHCTAPTKQCTENSTALLHVIPTVCRAWNSEWDQHGHNSLHWSSKTQWSWQAACGLRVRAADVSTRGRRVM